MLFKIEYRREFRKPSSVPREYPVAINDSHCKSMAIFAIWAIKNLAFPPWYIMRMDDFPTGRYASEMKPMMISHFLRVLREGIRTRPTTNYRQSTWEVVLSCCATLVSTMTYRATHLRILILLNFDSKLTRRVPLPRTKRVEKLFRVIVGNSFSLSTSRHVLQTFCFLCV